MSNPFSLRSEVAVIASLALATAVLAEIRITEYMYTGANGEFIEITNVGSTPVNLAGWSYDDSARVCGTFPIGAIGILAPGASAIITESTEAAFRAAWNLPLSVPVVGDLGKADGYNYGRNDTIALYDASLNLVDRLDYGDQDFPGSIRTQNISGWVVAEGLGANNAYAWQLSVVGDAQNSYDSSLNARGNPGTFVIVGEAPRGLGMVLTEYMYQGPGGEFVEFTNLSDAPIDMTGWKLDDSNLLGGPDGPFDLSAFGVVAPGESVIVTESAADAFRAAWGLSASVKVIGDLGKPFGNQLGRNDEINIYDDACNLVDRLTFGDQAFPGSIRAQNSSGWVPESALGANDPFAWVLATVGDAQNSYASTGNDKGNPGFYPRVTQPSTPGDANGDGVVNGADIAIVLGNWGSCPGGAPGCAGDLNGDGVVDGADIAFVLGNWS
ncbi:MAG: lamin tail domain-containing protein [Phycisphaeraceae bacterium]|nr:lamin tail domain-containing protein [Phycisphaeraceae bacterium]